MQELRLPHPYRESELDLGEFEADLKEEAEKRELDERYKELLGEVVNRIEQNGMSSEEIKWLRGLDTEEAWTLRKSYLEDIRVNIPEGVLEYSGSESESKKGADELISKEKDIEEGIQGLIILLDSINNIKTEEADSFRVDILARAREIDEKCDNLKYSIELFTLSGESINRSEYRIYPKAEKKIGKKLYKRTKRIDRTNSGSIREARKLSKIQPAEAAKILEGKDVSDEMIELKNKIFKGVEKNNEILISLLK